MSGTDKPAVVPSGSTAQPSVTPAPLLTLSVRPEPAMQRFTKSLPKGDLQKG